MFHQHNFYNLLLLIPIIYYLSSTTNAYPPISTAHDFVSGIRQPHLPELEQDSRVILPVVTGDGKNVANVHRMYNKPPPESMFTSPHGRFAGPHHRVSSNVKTKNTYLNDRSDSQVQQGFSIMVQDDPSQPRHPYTEFMVSEPANDASNPSSRSPLDYGYPESFRFVQELNNLPKNHKPTWDIGDESSNQHFHHYTDFQTPKPHSDPFQMFESVKPLEINKMLSLRPLSISVTETIPDDITTKSIIELGQTFIPKFTQSKSSPLKKVTKPSTPFSKSSKPNKEAVHSQQFQKSTAEYNSDMDFAAAQYHTLFAQTSKTAHPPRKVATIIREIVPYTTTPQLTSTEVIISTSSTSTPTTTPSTTNPPSISTSPTSTTQPLPSTTKTPVTPTTTTIKSPISPNLSWGQSKFNGTTAGITTIALSKQPPGSNLKSSDLLSLTRILGDDFISTTKPPMTSQTLPSESTPSTISPELRNMLISLGIIKSEVPSLETITTTTEPTTTTTTTTETSYISFNSFKEKASVIPVVDLNSYSNFKRIPLSEGRNHESSSSLSDDMKDLLASFGILPQPSGKQGNELRRHSTSFNSRMSRNEKLDDLTNEASQHDELLMMPENLQTTLENLGLLKSLALNKDGHVFQPTVNLEKLDNDQVKKINEAIQQIRKMSKNKDTNNMTVEEIEKQLENVTTLLHDSQGANEVGADGLNDTINDVTASKIIDALAKIPIGSENDTFVIQDSIQLLTPEETSTTLTNLTSTNGKVNSTAGFGNETSSLTSSGTKINSPGETAGSKNDTSFKVSISVDELSPLSPNEVNNQLDADKVEFKRQQPSSVSSTTSLPSTIIDPEDTFTTMEPASTTEMRSMESTSEDSASSNNSPNPALAESFGGPNDTSSDSETAAAESDTNGSSSANSNEVSTARPNGLYYYVDWNSFLEVGDADSRTPVRIRFSPRAGSARNFLPITVP